MEHASTIIVLPWAGSDWSSALDVLSERYAYRVISAGSVAEALTTLGSIHVDLAIAEDCAGEATGLDFLTRLRVSHPEIMRVYVTPGSAFASEQALSQAAIYQFILAPLDVVQLGLVVERALETRELARRHRILSREFKISGGSSIFGDRSGPTFRQESQRFEKLIYVVDLHFKVGLGQLLRKSYTPIETQSRGVSIGV
ncbi:hypothetical protein [Aminobacter carboxidus]|uniref:Response regulatory domain-containing protein n=1 Tax=Aminobacter carboxidus TaxID=376165 RepID=A0ABR9GVG9_9HYPH|nr:hypothetical protein [Aminobacter carboxidus]MBE1207533.1 hypothetical protein [Aminobacter carboxidus]